MKNAVALKAGLDAFETSMYQGTSLDINESQREKMKKPYKCWKTTKRFVENFRKRGNSIFIMKDNKTKDQATRFQIFSIRGVSNNLCWSGILAMNIEKMFCIYIHIC